MKNSNSSKVNNKGAKVETISGRTLITILNAATSGSVSLSPAAFPRAAAIADVFEFYRFTSVRVTLPTSSQAYAVGYTNQQFDTAPATIFEVMELPYAQRQESTCTVYHSFSMGRKELIGDGQIKWWKTIPGTPATQFELQGTFYGAGGSQTLYLTVEWTVEFCQWNLAAQSPKPVMGDFVLVPGTNLYRKVEASESASGKKALVLREQDLEGR